MKPLFFCSILSVSAFCMAFTGGGAQKGAKKFVTDPKTGVRYHFFKQDKKAPKAQEMDVATVIMVYRNDKDSLVLDSRKPPTRRITDTIGVLQVPLKKSFNGCLEQGIEMMAVGDSAEFLINTDSLFTKTFHLKKLPPYVHSGTDLTFDIKLVKFQTQDQIKEEQQQQMIKQQMETAQRKAQESEIITKYLADNNIHIQPTQDSLYFLSRQDATGRQIQVGDSISVKYTGMLLSGKVFDASSLHGGAPLTMVYSPSMPLIKGWVIALGTMHEGEKVRILLPSALAYGARQASADILPYTPLIFDMEVVKVTPAK